MQESNSDDSTRRLSPDDALALRPKDAAKALGIGQRKLWELTQPRGPIPAAKIGTCVVYPVDGLRKWLADEAAKAVKP